MAKAKYNDPAYLAAKKALRPVVAAGEAFCVQPVCVMTSRWIAPGTPWHLGHDDSGTMIIGPTHARCNTRDGAVRGNKMRARRPAAPASPPRSNRWIL